MPKLQFIVSRAFNPLTLDPVLWLDPKPPYLFQDAAMTTPVTAHNDPVGAILDRSGLGRHVLQIGDNTTRPLYQTGAGLHWLVFDGSNDHLRATFATNQPWERVSGIRQLSWTNGDRIFGPAASADRGFLFQNNASPTLSLYDGASACDNTDAVVDSDVVAIERHNGASSRLGIDAGTYSTGDPGSTNNDGITLAADVNGGSSNGHFRFYGMTMFDYLLTDSNISKLRTYYAAKQGRIL